ncbi:hypothetical protein GQ44DRAFT_614577, partial [Phaeosphaeriaceae sp. PMI808]
LVQKKLSKHNNVAYDDINAVVKKMATKRASKQGFGSATRRMLAKRASEIDAKEASTGQPAAWLYAAERKRFGQQHKAGDKSTSKLPPIVIKNMLPGSHSDTLMRIGSASSTNRLIIPGFCDTAVEEFIRDITLKKGFDLVQIYEEQNSGYFINKDV